MAIVYLVPGNMTGGPYGIKELKRREKLLKDWSFNSSNVKVYDVPKGGSSIESSYEEIASIIPAVDLKLLAGSWICLHDQSLQILGCSMPPACDPHGEPPSRSFHQSSSLLLNDAVRRCFWLLLTCCIPHGSDHHLLYFVFFLLLLLLQVDARLTEALIVHE